MNTNKIINVSTLLENSLDQLKDGILGFQSRRDHLNSVKDFLKNYPKFIDAWLVWYSSGDEYPICLFFEPKFTEHYFDIKKIKLQFEN